MFALTTDRSSSPRRYAIGSLPSALKRPTSSLANPWGNGYWQSFNSKLREELLNGEIFFSLAEAQVLIEAWRRQFNAVRPAVPQSTSHGSPSEFPSSDETPHCVR